MDIQSFYAFVSGTCFTLVGLWWNVVRGKPQWSKNSEMKELATGVNLAFLVPALVSMVASLGGENEFLWRGMFIVAAGFGIYFTTRLAGRTTLIAARMGTMHRNRWGVSALYALMLVLAIFPQLAWWVGIQPLQLGGILLALLVLSGHALTWEFLLGSAGDE